VFTVILPLRRSVEVEAPEPRVQAEGRARELGACRLLIIEANPLAQSVLRSTFGARVRELEITASADEALQAMGLGVFDHVLADGAALGGAEDERLSRLSAISAAGEAAVSVMWPSPDEATRTRILAAGAVQVLAKPIAPADLAAALGRWFSEASETAAAPAQTGVTAC
jgi:CheY-like chemotaxis protein